MVKYSFLTGVWLFLVIALGLFGGIVGGHSGAAIGLMLGVGLSMVRLAMALAK